MATFAFHCGSTVYVPNQYDGKWINCPDGQTNMARISETDIPITNLGDTTEGEGNESGAQLVADLTELISTFDPTTFEVVTAAMLVGLAAGWAGGFVINAIYKGKKI